MREYRVVTASDIDIGDRAIRPNDKELDDLVSDIRTRGLQTPILVDENMNLIDGLRRLQAFGPKELVDIVISDNYVETLEIMKLNRRGDFRRDWDMRRAWDFHFATRDHRTKNHYEQVKKGSRKKGGGVSAAMGMTKSTSVSRDMLAVISGMQVSVIQAGLYLYARAYGLIEEDDPKVLDYCKEMVVKMDEGYSPYSARYDLRKIQDKRNATITTASEQRKILRGATASAASLTRVFSEFGDINKGISVEEAKSFYDTLSKTRTELILVTRKLKERIGRK